MVGRAIQAGCAACLLLAAVVASQRYPGYGRPGPGPYFRRPSHFPRPPPPPIHKEIMELIEPLKKEDGLFPQGQGGSGMYALMLPLLLLGIGIPAIGFMYTYLSRRRRRDLGDDHQTDEQMLYYLDFLHRAVVCYTDHQKCS